MDCPRIVFKLLGANVLDPSYKNPGNFFNGNAPVLVGVELNIRKRIAHIFKNILPKLTKQKNIYFILVTLSFNKHSILINFSF